jgi:hypothetical protein
MVPDAGHCFGTLMSLSSEWKVFSTCLRAYAYLLLSMCQSLLTMTELALTSFPIPLERMKCVLGMSSDKNGGHQHLRDNLLVVQTPSP